MRNTERLTSAQRRATGRRVRIRMVFPALPRRKSPVVQGILWRMSRYSREGHDRDAVSDGSPVHLDVCVQIGVVDESDGADRTSDHVRAFGAEGDFGVWREELGCRFQDSSGAAPVRDQRNTADPRQVRFLFFIWAWSFGARSARWAASRLRDFYDRAVIGRQGISSECCHFAYCSARGAGLEQDAAGVSGYRGRHVIRSPLHFRIIVCVHDGHIVFLTTAWTDFMGVRFFVPFDHGIHENVRTRLDVAGPCLSA